MFISCIQTNKLTNQDYNRPQTWKERHVFPWSRRHPCINYQYVLQQYYLCLWSLEPIITYLYTNSLHWVPIVTCVFICSISTRAQYNSRPLANFSSKHMIGQSNVQPFGHLCRPSFSSLHILHKTISNCCSFFEAINSHTCVT